MNIIFYELILFFFIALSKGKNINYEQRKIINFKNKIYIKLIYIINLINIIYIATLHYFNVVSILGEGYSLGVKFGDKPNIRILEASTFPCNYL